MATMAKKKPKTVTMYVRIREDLKKELESLAERNRRPTSMELEIAIEERLEKERNSNPPD